MRVGIIGCGNISHVYLDNLTRLGGGVEVVGCADLVIQRAKEQAQQYGVPRAYAVDELLADPDIDIVLNLTIPAAHAQISLAAVAAGKHVYTEKPLSVAVEDGRQLLAAAAAAGVRVGCAPDTFLGTGIQTCRDLIDDGIIGAPVAAAAYMLCPGHEGWHPSPDFYYQRGGGPLFDMGPYYLTALVAMLGPIARVNGMARASYPQRTAADGHVIDVEVDTHVIGALEFSSGVLAQIVTSFDVQAGRPGGIEVYGTHGSLHLADPNNFGGPVQVARKGEPEWHDAPTTRPYADEYRGIGLVEMAAAIRAGRPHLASGELGQHVLDVMGTILTSARTGTRLDIGARCERPAPFDPGWVAK